MPLLNVDAERVVASFLAHPLTQPDGDSPEGYAEFFAAVKVLAGLGSAQALAVLVVQWNLQDDPGSLARLLDRLIPGSPTTVAMIAALTGQLPGATALN